MKSHLFSCVIPIKGPRPYFNEALTSLHNQAMGDKLEIIVQDGDVEPDAGQSDALNKGFAKAQGEWLFWLNADDVLLPGALKKVEALIGRMAAERESGHVRAERIGQVDWIAGNTVYIDANGLVKGVRTDAKWRPWFGKCMSVWTGGPSAFFRRSLWAERGGFDIGLKFVMDIDLWTRWAKVGIRFESVDDYLWGFRIHPGSATMGGGNEIAHRAEKEMVLSRHGLRRRRLWQNLNRVASVVDGSWLRRKFDSKSLSGKHWTEVGR